MSSRLLGMTACTLQDHPHLSQLHFHAPHYRHGGRGSLGAKCAHTESSAPRAGWDHREQAAAPHTYLSDFQDDVEAKTYTDYRASGLNLVVAVIIPWNTVYLERAIQAPRDTGQDIDEKPLPHLPPLGWEHINLTGDYIWQQNKLLEQGKFRPLRMLDKA